MRILPLAVAFVLLTSACSGKDGTGSNARREPSASAGADQTVTLGDLAQLNGSQSTSRSGEQLAYAWSFLARPAGSAATLSAPQSATTSFAVDAAGDYTLELRVSDSAGSDADTVIVHTNRRPLADAGADQDIAISDTVQLDASGSTDPDGNALTYSWTLLAPSGSSATLVSATAPRPTFVADVSGTYRGVLQLSDGHTSVSDTVTIEASFAFTAISAAGNYTCGLLEIGRVYCWGSGALGFAGSNPGEAPTTTRPHRIASVERFQSISAGGSNMGYFACGVTDAGKGYCWGANESGQLGVGTRTAAERTPVAVVGNLSFQTISVGGHAHACGITTTGDAYCWGNNGAGALGNNSYLSSAAPVAVSGGLKFQAIIALRSSSCGLTTSGNIYCWGGAPDLLGTGEISADHPAPVPVGSGRTWVRLFGTTADAQPAVCAIASTAEAFCWGFNDLGKLGNGRLVGCYDGSGPCERTPVAVQGSAQWAAVSPGGAHSCGLTTSGQLYCWGLADAGQLGTEVSTVCTSVGFPPPCSFVPVAVAPQLRFKAVSASVSHTCALTTSGQAYCWGNNSSGQLGDGTKVERRTPTMVLTP